MLTAAIKALRVVFLGSNRTRADPTATASTVVPGTDFSAAETFFAESGKPSRPDDRPDPAELFEQIGRLKMDLEWLKKKLPDG